MSGIDERSEKRANELEEEAWKMAKEGIKYLTPENAFIAVDKFATALNIINGDGVNTNGITLNVDEERRIELLVFRGDARRLRQWYDLAIEDYEAALDKMRAMPRVRQALLQPGIADVEEKINATAREGVSFYPDLAKYIKTPDEQ
ncbi:MAG: hypothetical protein LBI28_02995 [Treponema sp.]|nr:hypothetical protein [Treponema sp.]